MLYLAEPGSAQVSPLRYTFQNHKAVAHAAHLTHSIEPGRVANAEKPQVVYRHPPLPTVTHRHLPLPTVTLAHLSHSIEPGHSARTKPSTGPTRNRHATAM